MEINCINNIEEIVNRLVANNFECKYDKNSNIVKFMSCSRYEENKYDLIGYDYVEEYQFYEVSLDEIVYQGFAEEKVLKIIEELVHKEKEKC